MAGLGLGIVWSRPFILPTVGTYQKRTRNHPLARSAGRVPVGEQGGGRPPLDGLRVVGPLGVHVVLVGAVCGVTGMAWATAFRSPLQAMAVMVMARRRRSCDRMRRAGSAWSLYSRKALATAW